MELKEKFDLVKFQMELKEKLDEISNNSFDFFFQEFKTVLINSFHTKRKKLDLITVNSIFMTKSLGKAILLQIPAKEEV